MTHSSLTHIACPVCGSMTSWQGNPERPFCSPRCRLRDLAAWADGDYRIPGVSSLPEADDGDDDDSSTR